MSFVDTFSRFLKYLTDPELFTVSRVCQGFAYRGKFLERQAGSLS